MAEPATAEFDPLPSSLAGVRAFVRRSCPGLDDFDLLKLIIVTNEMATNAVVHAQSRYRVDLITLRGAVRVEVHDSSDQPAQLSSEPSATRGRGMVMVERLVRRWDSEVRQDGTGKIVWAELETPSLGA